MQSKNIFKALVVFNHLASSFEFHQQSDRQITLWEFCYFHSLFCARKKNSAKCIVDSHWTKILSPSLSSQTVRKRKTFVFLCKIYLFLFFSKYLERDRDLWTDSITFPFSKHEKKCIIVDSHWTKILSLFLFPFRHLERERDMISFLFPNSWFYFVPCTKFFFKGSYIWETLDRQWN